MSSSPGPGPGTILYAHQETLQGSKSPSELISRSTSHISATSQPLNTSDSHNSFEVTLQPKIPPPRTHKFGNPSALALAAYSITTFTLGLFLAGAMGIRRPNLILSMAVFYGGIIQFLAGAWELVSGNCLAGTMFVSYGSFWLSFAAISLDAFGIMNAYVGQPRQFGNAVGLYLIGWCIFTAMLVSLNLKSTIPFVIMLISLDFGFILLSIAFMARLRGCFYTSGIMLITSSLCAGYTCFAGITTKQNSYFQFKAMPMPGGKSLESTHS